MLFLPLGLLAAGSILAGTPSSTLDPVPAAAGSALVLYQPVAADAEEAKRWSVTPYFWATEIDGAVTARGNRASGTVSFSDILDHLDLALLLHAERAGKDWAILFDGVSMWLAQDFDGPLDAEFELMLATIEVASAYRLANLDEKFGIPVTIDGLGGVRYVYMEVELDTTASSSRSQDADVLDPIVGVRGSWRIAEKFSFGARADIGGFGIGTDLSWQLIGTIGWDPKEWLSVLVGYRLLDIDMSEGDGNQEHGIDMQIRGPAVGVTFRF